MNPVFRFSELLEILTGLAAELSAATLPEIGI